MRGGRKPLFEKYLALLLKWNKTYNLTAITDPQEIWIKHFEDSLSLAPHLPKGCRMLDIGTGGGFPGIPIKIERPDVAVVLLDSSRKKTDFCRAVIRELRLETAEAVQGRAEYPDPILEKFGFFDVVTTRATFPAEKFLEIAGAYLVDGGTTILMKGREWEKKEGLPSPVSGWRLDKKVDYALKDNLGKRVLLFFIRTKDRRSKDPQSSF